MGDWGPTDCLFLISVSSSVVSPWQVLQRMWVELDTLFQGRHSCICFTSCFCPLQRDPAGQLYLVSLPSVAWAGTPSHRQRGIKTQHFVVGFAVFLAALLWFGRRCWCLTPLFIEIMHQKGMHQQDFGRSFPSQCSFQGKYWLFCHDLDCWMQLWVNER